ncbi:MAG: hypothetical protein O7B99_04565 [Planctomycetota bacterium]|nr:hypothetical protein [Planctomycetota bacterium]
MARYGAGKRTRAELRAALTSIMLESPDVARPLSELVPAKDERAESKPEASGETAREA